MAIDLVFGGLLLISIAWAIQLYSLVKYGNDIRPSFAALYGGGVLMLLLDNMQKGATEQFLLNFFSLGAVALMFIVLIRSNKS